MNLIQFFKTYKITFFVLVLINIVRHGNFSPPAIIGGFVEGVFFAALLLIGWGIVTRKLWSTKDANE